MFRITFSLVTATRLKLHPTGRKMVLESRRAAAQLHAISRFTQRNRNVGFRMGNAVLKLFSRR